VLVLWIARPPPRQSGQLPAQAVPTWRALRKPVQCCAGAVSMWACHFHRQVLVSVERLLRQHQQVAALLPPQVPAPRPGLRHLLTHGFRLPRLHLTSSGSNHRLWAPYPCRNVQREVPRVPDRELRRWGILSGLRIREDTLCPTGKSAIGFEIVKEGRKRGSGGPPRELIPIMVLALLGMCKTPRGLRHNPER